MNELADALVTLGVMMVFFIVIAAVIESFTWMNDNF